MSGYGPAAFVWPRLREPESYALGKRWAWHDEMFLNNVGSTSHLPGWVQIGAALVDSVTAEPSARGVLQLTFTRSPVALPAAWRRTQATNFVALNDFQSEPLPTFWTWGRFRQLAAKPDPAGVDDYYVSAFGIGNQPVGVVEPTDGFGVVFDATLGVDQWVLRAWRAGVAIDLPLGIPWVVGAAGNTDGWATVALHHKGTGIDAYVGDPRLGIPMVQVGTLIGAEIQPGADVLGYFNHVEQRNMGLTFDPVQQTDFIGFGAS